MTTDLYPRIAVDVVIFTVVSEDDLRSMVWDETLLSPAEHLRGSNNGLSLFAITLQNDSASGRVLPGGFMSKTETIAAAARRVLRDQVGLEGPIALKEIGTFDNPKRDATHRTISFAYWAMVSFDDIRATLGGEKRVGLEMVNSPRFMANFKAEFGGLENYDGVSRFGYRLMPKNSPLNRHEKRLPGDLGTRILGLDHDEMVFYAWRKLRHAFTGRVDPFNYLGMNPLGEVFRISDMQAFQEVCRGESVQRDFFRRNMINEGSFLTPTDLRDSSRPGKPATLYRLTSPPMNSM